MTRLAIAAGLLAGSSLAQAQDAPPGYVFQGTFHDGHWDGQWIPGGAPQGGMPGYGPVTDRETQHMLDRCRNYRHDGVAGGAVVGAVAGGVIGNRLAGGDRVGGTIAGAAVGGVTGAAIEHGVKRGRDRDCERFYRDHPEYAPGYGQAGYGPPPMGPYGVPPMAPYGGMPMAPYGAAPMGYMMVPVMQPAPAPYTETKTVTTTYVTDSRVVHHYHVVHKWHPRDKRVYTGS